MTKIVLEIGFALFSGTIFRGLRARGIQRVLFAISQISDRLPLCERRDVHSQNARQSTAS